MSEPAGTRRWPAVLMPSRAAQRIMWALLLALPLLWQLGGTPLFDVDEGAFSEATREMLVSGDWGHTTLNGAPRFDKPIGVYWLQAIAVRIFGLNEFALRLPSALSCWVMALALAAFAAARWGPRAGALAGAMTVSSVGFLVIGRSATADSLLNMLLVLAALDAWRYIESGKSAPLQRAYAWVGLGLLVKGPVALLVPGAAVFVWAVTSGRARMLVAALAEWRGWAWLLVLALPWYVYALHRDGMAFVDGFLLHHNVERFTGTIGGHRGSLLYYVAVMPLLLMPWTPLVAIVVARARSLWAQPLGRYLLGWSGFVLLFFSFSSTKLPHYALYGCAPLVLLMARALEQGRPWVARMVVASLLAWTCIIAAVPALVARFAPAVRDPLYHALVAGAPPVSLLAPALVLLLVAVLAWGASTAQRWWRLPVAAGAVALLVCSWSLPWFGATLQGPVRAAAAAATAHPGSIVQSGVHLPSFSVYTERIVPKVDTPQPGDIVLGRADRPPAGAARPHLFEQRGVVLFGPAAP